MTPAMTRPTTDAKLLIEKLGIFKESSVETKKKLDTVDARSLTDYRTIHLVLLL